MTEPSFASQPGPVSPRHAIAVAANGRHVAQICGGVGALDGRALVADAVAVAIVDGAVWFVVHDHDGDALWRFELDGTPDGTPTALGELGADVAITAARTGARVALIEGERAIVVRERGAAVVIDELGARGRDRRLHLAGRGVFERRGAMLALRGGSGHGLAIPAELIGATVVSGAIVLDGAAIAIELDTRGVRHVLMYDARRGELRSRLRIGEAAIAAIGERRGAIVIGRGRHLALLDLRAGRCTHERIFAAAVASVAATADADRFVIIDEHGTRSELTATLGDLDAHDDRDPHACVEAGPDVEPIAVIDIVDAEAVTVDAIAEPASIEPEPTPVEPAPIAPAPSPILRALRPCATPSALDASAMTALLDDTFELVAAWCHTAAVIARGPDVDGATSALSDARRREVAAHAELVGWEVATPMSTIAADYGLSPLACAILTIAAAPQIWGELARVYRGLVAYDARPAVDELLVCQLLEISRGGRAEVTRELDDGAPLVRHGLIAIGAGTRPFAALDVPHVVIRRLTGDRFHDASGAVVHRVADRTLDQICAPRERIAAVVAELLHPPATGEVRVVIRGRAGSGRRTLAAALARCAGRDLGVIEPIGAGVDAIAAVRRDLRDAHLRGWIACVTGLDAVALDDAQRAAIRALFDAHPGPLFVCAGVAGEAPIASGHIVVELPVLAVAERTACWRAAMTAHALPTGDAAMLAERYAVGPGAIARAVAAAAATDEVTGVGARIDRVVRQRRAVQLGALATRVEHLATWDDLVLPDDLLASVRELVARVRLRSTVLDAWGMDRVAATGRAVTALLQGGPGTGKTMVAGVVARELGYDLYRVDLSRVTSKWIGETEKNLGALFDAAEEGQCILLFDEADSLFGKRTEIKSSNDHHANLQVNYLLQRLDAFEGVAILTTNFGSAIDPAFKRRLALHVQFPFPDDGERERLWRTHLPATLPVAGDLELAALARTYQLSGGYIRNAILRAAYLAAAEHTPVTAALLRRAVQSEYRDRGKVAATGTLE